MASIILGIDEVGRGPWAGPLVVGAVILPAGEFDELTDSKKLTAKKREALAPQIHVRALATGLGWVSSAELDQYGLSASLKLATRRAVKQALAQKVKFDEIVIDGTVNFLQNTPLADRVTTLPKADFLVKSVSAASIIAKVARDAYMVELGAKYPGYGFESHMGYGTAAHRAALEKQGVCPEHRMSFRPVQAAVLKRGLCTSVSSRTDPFRRERDELRRSRTKKMLAFSSEATPAESAVSVPSLDEARSPVRRGMLGRSPTTKGQTAELAVADYLTAQNHKIIAHNFKTKTYEIDLISTASQAIYFTEVKYSQKTAAEGTPLARITAAKQRQMHYAAEKFLASHSSYADLQPLLAVASVTGADFAVREWFALNI